MARTKTMPRRQAVPSQPSSPSPKPISNLTRSTVSSTSIVLVVAAGVLIRVVGFSVFDAHTFFAPRMEISTPVTAFERLEEASYLLSRNVDPYTASIVHHTPLMLALFKWLPSFALASHMAAGIFIIADVAAVCMLVAMAAPILAWYRSHSSKNETNAPSPSYPHVATMAAAAYMLSPFAIVTCFAHSTVALTNLAIILGLFGAVKGYKLVAWLGIAWGAYDSLYPIILTLPVANMMSKMHHTPQYVNIAGVTVTIAALLAASAAYTNFDLTFLSNVYGCILYAPDLKPNVGLFWYFFLEVFDHYRVFFTAFFQIMFWMAALPLWIHFKHDPFAGFICLVGCISIFKSYPSVGDSVLVWALLPFINTVMVHSRHMLLQVIIIGACTVTAPCMLYLWLYAGSANANFFYAITLIYTVTNGTLVADIIYCHKKFMYYTAFGEKSIPNHSLTLGNFMGDRRKDPQN